jgi:uncharacterized protein YecE (DUF72 family)
MRGASRCHIGTSGWYYAHWQGAFYTSNLPTNRWLQYYASRFRTVEINNTFYRLPEPRQLAQWRETVPPGFVFSVKASRYITHRKKLKEPRQSLRKFFDTIRVLREKLGPILFQLPPRWAPNPERLAEFLRQLPPDYRYAFECRDARWWTHQTSDLLASHNAAWCIFDLAGQTSPKYVTTDFVYLRLHGPSGPYQGQYSVPTLAGWAGAFATWLRQGREIYCYFDNDEAAHAPHDAQRLQAMVG